MGSAPTAPAPVQPIRPVPPPAQVSASLAAVRGAKANAQAAGDLGGTILAGADISPDAAAMRTPGQIVYGGKQLTGA